MLVRLASGASDRRDEELPAPMPPGMAAMQVADPTRTTAMPVRTLKHCFRLATAHAC